MRLLIDVLLPVLRCVPCEVLRSQKVEQNSSNCNILTFREIINRFDMKYSCWKILFLFMNDIFIWKAKSIKFCGTGKQLGFMPMATG
jgi:hypothetical protein